MTESIISFLISNILSICVIYELLNSRKEQRNLSDSIEYRECVHKYILGKSSNKVNKYMDKVIDNELHILALKKKISE